MSQIQKMTRIIEVLDDDEAVMPIDPALLNLETGRNYVLGTINYKASTSQEITPAPAASSGANIGSQPQQANAASNNTANDATCNRAEVLTLLDECLNNGGTSSIQKTAEVHPYLQQSSTREQSQQLQDAMELCIPPGPRDGIGEEIETELSRFLNSIPLATEADLRAAGAYSEIDVTMTNSTTPATWEWNSGSNAIQVPSDQPQPQQQQQQQGNGAGKDHNPITTTTSTPKRKPIPARSGRGGIKSRSRAGVAPSSSGSKSSSPSPSSSLNTSSYYIAFRTSYPTIAKDNQLSVDQWGKFKECAKDFFLESDARYLFMRANHEEWQVIVMEFADRYAEAILSDGVLLGGDGDNVKGKGKGAKSRGRGNRGNKGRGRKNGCYGGRDQDSVLHGFGDMLKAVRRGFRESVTRQTKINTKGSGDDPQSQ